MARQRIRKRPMAEINVVPYIDVMLVMLVIFMVTAPLLSQGVKVELPQAPSEPLENTAEEPLVVSVDRHRNGDTQFITRRIDDSSDVPIIHGAIGIGTPLRLGNFNDNRCIGSLGGL